MSPKAFRQAINDLGMELVAGHCDVFNDFARKVAEGAEAGLESLVCPWFGPQETMEGYQKAAATFNQCGALCAQQGLGFAYHHHDYSLRPLPGHARLPQKVMMEDTNPAWVSFEMDVYWVVVAGHDPVAWLTRYPDRWRMAHLKDKLPTENPADTFISTQLGEGTIDFQALLEPLQTAGVVHVLVEQERFDGISPLEACKKNAAYMRALLKLP